jgi:dipeptidyl aminopeptidase/acylaminoacyl peptidase
MSRTALTATDLWSMHRVGQPEPAPDGDFAVVPVTTYDLDSNEGVTRIWQIDRTGKTRPLTRGDTSSTQPALDAAASRVAFLRKAGAGTKPQLHVMPRHGGEPECVTDLPLGVAAVKWLPDGSGVVLAVPLLLDFPSIAATTAELERRGENDTAPLVTENRIYRYWKRWLVGGEIHHLFHLDLDSSALTDLTPELNHLIALDDPAGSYAIAPGGDEIAYTADVAPPPHERFRFAVHLVALAGGPSRLLAGAHDLPPQELRPRYSPDGRSIVYGVQREPDYYASRVELVAHDRGSGISTPLTPGWDRSAGGWEYAPDGALVLHAPDEGRSAIFTLRNGETTPRRITGAVHAHGPRPTTGPIWLRTESAAYPPEVTIIDPSGDMAVIGTFNQPILGDKELGAADEFHFTGSEGAEIQAHIVYPPGFDRSRRWPLIHNIHGGPHNAAMDQWHWRWNTQVFAAAGYVVVSVNFHGSNSFGAEFTRSIRGAWGEQPFADVMAATEHLIGEGYIDASRMAVTGGSYGGYLVSWIIANTDRFRAAICHAGVTDLVGQWASDITAGREHAVGGTPWEDMEAVLRWSPLAHTAAITTPTLVIHGEQDYRVVVTQGLSLYGILKHKGVEARLVYYPDEGHWIEKPRNSIHWYGEFLGWMQRHLGKEDGP